MRASETNWKNVDFYFRAGSQRSRAAMIERGAVDKVGPWTARQLLWPGSSTYRHLEQAPESAAERLVVSVDVLTRFVAASPRPTDLADRLVYQDAFDYVAACRLAELAGKSAPALPPRFTSRWVERSQFRLALLPVFNKLASINKAEVDDQRLIELCHTLCQRFLDVAAEREMLMERGPRKSEELAKLYRHMRAALAKGDYRSFEASAECFERLTQTKLMTDTRDLQHAVKQMLIAIDLAEGSDGVADQHSAWSAAAQEKLLTAEIAITTPKRRGRKPLAATNACMRQMGAVYIEITGHDSLTWSEPERGEWGGAFGQFASGMFDQFGVQRPSKKLLQNLKKRSTYIS